MIDFTVADFAVNGVELATNTFQRTVLQEYPAELHLIDGLAVKSCRVSHYAMLLRYIG